MKDVSFWDLSYSIEPVVYSIEAYLQESAATKGPGSEIPIGLSTYISKAIVRDLQDGQGGSLNRNRLRLSQLWEEVNANPGYEWKLSILAKKMHVSVRQFQRLMQENYSDCGRYDDADSDGTCPGCRMTNNRYDLRTCWLSLPLCFFESFQAALLPPATYRRMSEKLNYDFLNTASLRF